MVVTTTSLALASGAGARATGTNVTSASASGPGAVAAATGSASHPRLITVSIATVPSQRVTGTWSVVCTNGFSAGPKGEAATVTPLTRTFTFPATGPAQCHARATARLSGSGRVTVQIVRRT